MSNEHDLTLRIEETETGSYRARVEEAPERHVATGEDPMVAVRGALAVARGVVDSTVGYERSAENDRVLPE